MKKLPIQHLLVDLDGTLLGNRALSLSVDFLRHAYDHLKLQIGFRQAAQILLAMQKELKKTSAHHTNDLRTLKVFAHWLNLPIEETRRVVRDGLSTFFPKLEKHFFPIEGAKDFLDWAKKRYTLTLATNPVWPKEIIELRVRWAGIEPSIFQEITYAQRMHSYKPTPEYYREILSQQGLTANECLLIGNDLKMDLPATRVGIATYIVGPFKKVSHLHLKGAKAPAWKGSFEQLRLFLERHTQDPSPSSV